MSKTNDDLRPESPKAHAPLECPECGKVCKPRRETKDGGAVYRCTNADNHADFRNLSFTIDGDGEVHF